MDIVLFGAGQFADVVAVYLEAHSQDRIVAYTVDAAYRQQDEFRGLPLVDWESLEQFYPPGSVQILGPISFRDGNRFRRDRFEDGLARGYSFYTFVHPNCDNYAANIGQNVLILEGNTLQPYTEIGDNCILWSNNHIGHHTQLGKHCFLAGQVGLGGNTQVGEGVFLAGKSGAIDNVSIGDWSLMNFGAYATQNIPPDSIVASPKIRMIEGGAARYAKRLLG